MKVNVSPWEIAETRIGFAAAKKRRRSKSRESEHDALSGSLGFAARFVSSRRSGGSKKARANQTEQLVPTLVLTGEHRVSVLGAAKDSSLRESEQLQYSSRPGKTHSFLPSNPCSDVVSSTIPAIYDTKHELVYALQKENTRLLCWPAASGPEQAQTLSLDSPAVDLSLVRLQVTGAVVVYGSCQDGRAFLVQTVSSSSKNATTKMTVEYLEPPGTKAPRDSDGRVVATLMTSLGGKEERTAGSKRKSHSGARNDSQTLALYQLAVDDKAGGIVLRFQEVVLIRGASDLEVSVRSSRRASIGLPSSSSSTKSHEDVGLVQMIGICQEKNAMVIQYTLKDSHERVKENGHYSIKQTHLVGLLSLDTATFVTSPMELPADMKQVALVASTILAVGTAQELLLLDLMRGGRLHQESLPDRHPDRGYILTADHVRNLVSIAFVSNDGGKVCVALPTGVFLARIKSLAKGPVSLASSLAASLVSKHPKLSPNQFLRERSALTFGIGRNGATAQSRTNIGMDAIEQSSSIASMISGYKKILDDKPSEVSAALVDSATTMVVNLLCNFPAKTPRTVQTDASLLLRELIHTKKVFARTHLPTDKASDGVSFAALLKALSATERGAKQTGYSPVELVLDTLQYCPDVSERHMTASLRFMLCYASSDSVAEALQDDIDNDSNDLYEQYEASRKAENGAFKELSVRVIRNGVSILLDRIFSYGPCNESLLRKALADGLNRQEMGLVLRLLETKVSTRALQWLTALCDCLRGDASVDVKRIQKRISTERSKTEAMLSLKRVLDAPATSASLAANKTSDTGSTNSQLPPYQIERLLF